MPAIRVCPSGLRTSCRPIPFASRLLGSKPFPPVYTPRGEESPRGFAANSRSHQAASAPATRIPVRDCVSSSAANNTSERAQPSRKCRRHPQQNGKSAHIAAAAWLGFAKPNPMRATSPTTNSTMQFLFLVENHTELRTFRVLSLYPSLSQTFTIAEHDDLAHPSHDSANLTNPQLIARIFSQNKLIRTSRIFHLHFNDFIVLAFITELMPSNHTRNTSRYNAWSIHLHIYICITK